MNSEMTYSPFTGDNGFQLHPEKKSVSKMFEIAQSYIFR